MSKISRREFAKLAGSAALLPSIAFIQSKTQPEQEPKEVESKLAQPFSDEARKIARKSLADVKRTAADRWKFKLPENSEPCTTFTARKGRL